MGQMTRLALLLLAFSASCGGAIEPTPDDVATTERACEAPGVPASECTAPGREKAATFDAGADR
jgi:hypothetical protein